jgi:chromosome segregation protein
MKIKRVKISGFKSFSDETQIVFDQTVTAVVGPNGCGKSNIVDAIRWALGEQSAKNLRGKAMEDIIFNGSESRGPQSMAEVTIVFDNTDGLSHASYLDFTEISVTRRLYRDNPNSEYLLNNTPCRLRDVTDLFLGTGGGARAYSIIEQGRIGLIVSARAEDRRSIIEEAAGITKYKNARRTAERRMEQTRQNLLRVTDVLSEKERNLASLNRQAKKAVRYKKYREEQTDLELHVASHRYLELRARTVATQMALTEKKTIQEERRNTFATQEARVASMRLDEQESKSLLDNETRASYEINKEIEVVENEVRHLLDSVSRYQNDEVQLSEQETLAHTRLAELKDESTVLAEQLERVSQDFTATDTRFQELSEKTELSRTKLREIGEDHDKKRDQASRTRARKAAAESAVVNLGQRIEETESRLATIRDEHVSLKDQASKLETQASMLKERTLFVEQHLNTARSTEERERQTYEDLVVEVEESDAERIRIRNEIQSKLARKISLEEVMDGLEGHDHTVRDAVATLEKNSDQALNGLLIDFIACPEQYEQALAATLQDRLQALIVDDRDAGLKLLTVLKEKDIGRVTVVSKNVVKPASSKDISIDDTQVLGSLVSFLTLDPAVDPLIKGLLSEVFVVPDLTHAERLWKIHQGQAAFVTLDGQLLEKSGVMQGGKATSVGADLLGKKRQIRELSSELETLTELNKVVKQRFFALKEDLLARREAMATARQDGQDHEIKLAEVRKDASRASDDLIHLSRRFDAMAQEVAHEEEMLVQAKNDLELATTEGEDAGSEIAILEQAIVEQRSDIERYQVETDKLNTMVNDLRVRQASLEQQQQNIIDRQEQIERSRNEIEGNLESAGNRHRQVFTNIGQTSGKAFKQKEFLETRLIDAKHAQAKIEKLRGELEEKTVLLAEGEIQAKSFRAEVEAASEELSTLTLKEREIVLAIEHLLENVQERNDCNLLRVMGDFHLRDLPDDGIRARIDDLKNLINRMGPINLAAIDEFHSEKESFELTTKQKEDLDQALEDLEKAIAKMDRTSRRLFKETFDDVNRRFQKIFPDLFKGGNAHLQLTDPHDLLNTGVDIIARPPGKKPGNIELLSGGEKALTAVSLLFAIFLHRPSPFCILDEVDAPLDEANVERFVEMLKTMTERSQFIIITHSKLTMEKSDTLYGVTMEEPGISKMVSVRLNTFAPALAANS